MVVCCDCRQQIGSFLLSSIASTASDQLACHMMSLLTLCSTMLNESCNHLVAFYTVQYVPVSYSLTCMNAVAAWFSELALCWAQLVLGWVSIFNKHNISVS